MRPASHLPRLPAILHRHSPHDGYASDKRLIIPYRRIKFSRLENSISRAWIDHLLWADRLSVPTTYTFKDGTQAAMAMVATFTLDRKGKRRRKWQAFILVLLDWPPKKVHHRYRYRRRFGIETSYRQLRPFRALTTSLNPALRFSLLALGLLLTNIWSLLRWSLVRIMAPGPRRVHPLLFPFQRFVRFLLFAIDSTYGAIRSILTPLPLNP